MRSSKKEFLLLGLSILITAFPLFVSSRDGLKASIPDTLLPCYKHPLLKTKDLLLPMSMPVLINLVRKVENYQGLNMDMRSLSTTLLQRFRLDGIEFNPDVQSTEFIIPYSPSGPQFYKYKILMDKLIPSPTYRFPNESLNMVEQCTLHQMLSSSVNKWSRGDESTSCNRLTEKMSYSSRLPRSVDPQGYKDEQADVETFHPSAIRGNVGQPQSAAYRVQQFGLSSLLQESMCPIENGVVSTRYGSVKAGVVIAGIAAGLQPQTVSKSNLIEKRSMSQMSPSYPTDSGALGVSNTWAATLSGACICILISNLLERECLFSRYGSVKAGVVIAGIAAGLQPQTVSKSNLIEKRSMSQMSPSYPTDSGALGVSNTWAATLSGEIAEVVILEGPTDLNNMRVGVTGGWNSTLVPKYYLLNDGKDGAVTETDIRGGVDGYIMGNNIRALNDFTGGSLKLSQLLEMYYSEQGVFDTSFKGCKRKQKFGEVVSMNKLQQEIENVLADGLRDVQCARTEQVGPLSLPAVDLIVVIDCGWEFRLISDVLSYLVEQVDVSAYGSKITLVNGKDGSIMVNTTENIVDFYQNFNSSMYSMCYSRGFDMARTLRELKMRIEIEMNVQRRSLVGRYQQSYEDSYHSSRSDYYSQRQTTSFRSQEAGGADLAKVVLFVPQPTAGSGDGEGYYVRSEINYYRRALPDVTLLFFAPNSKQRFSDYAENVNKDVFVLTPNDVANSVNPLVDRISEVHKPIINPTCGSSWVGVSYNSRQTTAYLQSSGIHYYRVHANYFYKSSNARIRIQSQGVPLSVCYSRSSPWPNANRTRGSSDSSCRQVTSEAYELRIPDEVCSDVYAYQCLPYYISVAAPSSKMAANNFACRENECRYPDMVKYTISHEGLTCYSCVIKAIASPLLIAFALSILLKIEN
ncbi:uncharacterized protein LOC111043364 [Nilaparvata lugens]|uniref:uncharacterized protein LOC111043364 n=1 Tax=Nilaparvata lugens TaxID=108931 RepID=UPI00193D96D3|nr:uncharacterized protein LOC111043364 [Nilaparvata lugens]